MNGDRGSSVRGMERRQPGENYVSWDGGGFIFADGAPD